MINVKYPRRGFVVEEIVEGCKTEGCTAEKFVVNSWEHYGEDTFNDLTDGQSTGQHSTSDYTEGSCHKCKKPVVYKDYFVITSDANTLKTPEDAYYYALNVLKAPFPEGESLIATDAEYSYKYAKDILKAPFPLGETAIATDAKYSCHYAKDILKAPFSLGEPAIAKDAIYSYKYAKDILHAPFPLGEAAIATKGSYSYGYAQDVLHAPFPLGEKAIATNGYYIEIYKELFPETQVAPAQAPAQATSMSDKQKRKQKQKDVIKSTFLTLIFTLQDIIGYDKETGTYFWVGSLFEADSILKRIHDLMETFPNLTKNLLTKKYSKTYLKVKSYMDEYFKKMKEENEKEKQEKEKPNV
jgi:hypothetical protein